MSTSEETTNDEISTDYVIDALAAIELQRQELHAQADPEAWRKLALDKLEEIRRQLEEDLRLRGPSAERAAAAQALRVEISRVKGGAGPSRQEQPGSRAARSGRPAFQQRDGRRPPRNDQRSRPIRRRGGH
ncbi:MAG TPA: hypothetical protein VFX67_04475 [Burkholderiales bacterium]|nr:hypothetical protein [Burkholderiales bacterium]